MYEFLAEIVAELGVALAFVAHFGASALSTVVKSYDKADGFFGGLFRRVVDYLALNIGHARPESANPMQHDEWMAITKRRVADARIETKVEANKTIHQLRDDLDRIQKIKDQAKKAFVDIKRRLEAQVDYFKSNGQKMKVDMEQQENKYKAEIGILETRVARLGADKAQLAVANSVLTRESDERQKILRAEIGKLKASLSEQKVANEKAETVVAAVPPPRAVTKNKKDK